MTVHHLQIKDLWHHYGDTSAEGWTLQSINMNLESGELVGLLGPSGCGKTTLLRLIAGFDRPVQGRIIINDQEVASARCMLPPERRGVGMVFQDYALFPHLDAWRNACFGLRRGQGSSRAKWLMEMLGLADLCHRYPHQLSGGQRQRLALARALAPGASLVLLDEPFSSLDVEVRQRLRSELSGVLKTCGATGLLVTHDPQEALAICDRVAVLRDGELHQCSTPSDLVHKPATPFVGRFVLQGNLLPLDRGGEYWHTPVGPISRPIEPGAAKATELMVDAQALQIKQDPYGEARIQGREFFGNHWLLRVELGNHLLRVRQPLELPVNTGDRCFVAFRAGQKGILFPGAIPCPLS
ncbi:MAG TPA: ABC transporter ATP-binding protein [Prochlorococcus sp.]